MGTYTMDRLRIYTRLVASLLLTCSAATYVQAQVRCSASSDSGSGYAPILAAGLELETPDCKHDDFGAHVTQSYDSILRRNVFEFHSHIEDDNDRCQREDRVRMEIKGGPGSDLEAQHPIGSESYYRWKMRVAPSFRGASTFCHVFQNKIRGGADDSQPVLTWTLRADRLELLHRGGSSGADLGRLAVVDIEQVRGRWLEFYVYQRHDEAGALYATLRDINSNQELLAYDNDNIDLWRDGAEYSRPKWGIYRAKNSSLNDEIVSFADFCISESSSDLCPADTIMIQDTVPPSRPMQLTGIQESFSRIDLSWIASTDNVGVQDYTIYRNGEPAGATAENTYSDSVAPSTTYTYYVIAEDNAGNQSVPSDTLTVTTADSLALPTMPTLLAPADASAINTTSPLLSWTPSRLVDYYRIYIDTLPSTTINDSTSSIDARLQDLSVGTTYYWSVGAVNRNGETRSPTWSFSVEEDNQDAPWLVYRADHVPNEEADWLTVRDRPAAPKVDNVLPDTFVVNNNIYSFSDDSEDKFRWRYSFPETDTSITIVARFRAVAPDMNCVCYFEVNGFGFREKVRVNQSTVKLERSTPIVEPALPFDIAAGYHLLRMTMTGNTAEIYLDEASEPFAVGNSTTTSSAQHFEWGKSGSNPCGGTIDWIAILPNAAYSPSEGPPLPQDLILSNDALLTEITIDGVAIDDLDSETYTYEVDVTGRSTPPTLDATTRSALASVDIDQPTTVPNTEARIIVTAQDDVTQRTYTIRYTTAVSTTDQGDALTYLYPNPTDGIVRISEYSDRMKANVYNTAGQLLAIGISADGVIDLRPYPSGIYHMSLTSASGAVRHHVITKY